MGFRRLLPGVLGGTPRVYYECRRCGESLDGVDDVCEHCEESTVAAYELRA